MLQDSLAQLVLQGLQVELEEQAQLAVKVKLVELVPLDLREELVEQDQQEILVLKAELVVQE